jgi:uncharacterized protein YoxC
VVSLAISVTGIVAMLVLGIGLILSARAIIRLASGIKKLTGALDTFGRDARPVLDRARAIGENLNFIVMSVRREVDRVGETIGHANARLQAAIDSAEQRVQELGALIDVVQGEVEDTLLTASSALRGLRTGAKMLRRRQNQAESQDDEPPDA